MRRVDEGMLIELDVPIAMDDGTVLRADVFRPADEDASPLPVILSVGPYGKSLHFQDGQPYQWQRMSTDHPDTVTGTSNRYQSWEVVDPEKWVPDGFAVVRVDARGTGRSPGVMELLSEQETQDLCSCIEWSATQPWSSGKVGLNGVSYYAIKAWQTAARRPRHLAAMCAWEGASDLYREWAFHGGIWNGFNDTWYPNRVLPRQHGRPSAELRSRLTGEQITGPDVLREEELAALHVDYRTAMMAHPFVDDYWETLNPDLSRIEVPLLSAGNWGGAGLHLRGNVEGFLAAGSQQKWLELHGLEHWTHFHTDYGLELQKQFFAHFLRGEDNGWDRRPPVLAQVRTVDGGFVERTSDTWPLPETEWTPYVLDLEDLSLHARTTGPDAPSTRSYDALSDGLTFLAPPQPEQLTLVGPMALRLFLSSDTEDADVFVVVRAFAPDLAEVTFQGSNAPHAPLGIGWLRASHRELDEVLSTPCRPVHTHRHEALLTPGDIYQLDVEIWPTSVVLPAGYRLGVSVRGRDYVWPGATGPASAVQGVSATANAQLSGVGPFRHIHPRNRPAARFAGTVTLHADPDRVPRLLVPVVPSS